jgi:NAD(P)-dependent dehydrogenase (short-subunit alcohol dehydrogenase family)
LISADEIRQYAGHDGLLKDRVVLVTGAGSGIGRAAAMIYAKYGATVVLLGRRVAKLEAVYDEILAAGDEKPSISAFNLESGDLAQYIELAESIDSMYGRLDGLLHNAGLLGDMTPIEHYDPVKWQQVMHVNLTSVFLLTRACLPLLKKSKDASVILTSSGVGRKGRAYWGAYAVSKFGTEGFMEILADETEENTNIRVNSINPGRTRTNMRATAYPGEDPDTLKTPENIMGPYLFLMGPDGSGTTGQRFDCQVNN